MQSQSPFYSLLELEQHNVKNDPLKLVGIGSLDGSWVAEVGLYLLRLKVALTEDTPALEPAR